MKKFNLSCFIPFFMAFICFIITFGINFWVSLFFLIFTLILFFSALFDKNFYKRGWVYILSTVLIDVVCSYSLLLGILEQIPIIIIIRSIIFLMVVAFSIFVFANLKKEN